MANGIPGKQPVLGSSVPLRLLLLTVFPVLQVGLFGLSCLFVTTYPAWAVGCVLASAAVLNFSVHICVHEFLHYSDRHPLAAGANLLISVTMGQAFNGYRFHHHNHHRHNNGESDFSRTWRMTAQGNVRYGLWRYMLGWPAQTMRARRALVSLLPSPVPLQRLRRRVRLETVAILAVLLVLGLCSWKFAAMYVAMVYVGWALVSLHNYGQHPPHAPADIQSYSGRLYNRLFFNNGLHFEHHAEPLKRWHELRADAEASQINEPHLVSPLWRQLRTTVGGRPLHGDATSHTDKNTVADRQLTGGV